MMSPANAPQTRGTPRDGARRRDPENVR
jgi:hypothetical protein